MSEQTFLDDPVDNQALINELQKTIEVQAIWAEALAWTAEAQQKLESRSQINDCYTELLYRCQLLSKAKLSALCLFDKKGNIVYWHNAGLAQEQVLNISRCDGNQCLIDPKLCDRGILPIKQGSTILKQYNNKNTEQIANFIAIPLNIGSKAHATIFLANKSTLDNFTMQDSVYISQLGSQIVYMVNQFLKLQELQDHNDALQAEREQQLTNELEETQQQLLQSEKMAAIGQIAAGVAHEINNPLGYVNSNLTSLENYINDFNDFFNSLNDIMTDIPKDKLTSYHGLWQRLDLDFVREDIHELLVESFEGINRVKNIVQSLKDFSHTSESEWQVVDLHQGIESTLNIVHNELKYKATIEKNFTELPEVECIPSQINQVLLNLLVNAGHAIDNEGTITINTGSDAQHAWIDVIDNGSGIPKEQLSRIFDPFFTTKPIGQGTGLGLSVSYGIIQKHKGKLKVDSTVGKGTRFRIILPIKHA